MFDRLKKGNRKSVEKQFKEIGCEKIVKSGNHDIIQCPDVESPVSFSKTPKIHESEYHSLNKLFKAQLKKNNEK